MTRPAADEVLYAEPGSGPAPLLWGPGFAVVGFLLDLYAAARPHTVAWIVIGVVLFLCCALWVYGRRRFMSVRVTGSRLSQGSETLAVDRIAGFCDDEAPMGTRVLGGGYTVPRKCGHVTLLLDDGSRAVAWARDAQRLRAALDRVVET